MIAELDRLSEKVEMARTTIVKLREDNRRLLSQCDELRLELERFRAAGVGPDQLAEHAGRVVLLESERNQLMQEREEVAERVRGILGKVEALEELS